MSAMKWMPEGYARITPMLTCEDIDKTIEFYQKAFGFESFFKMPGPGGKTMHAEIGREDIKVMLGATSPEQGCQTPKSLGGSSTLYLYVQDVDAFAKQAFAAGAQEIMPVTDMFWGDRCAMLADLDGQKWMVATHTKDIAPEDMKMPEACT